MRRSKSIRELTHVKQRARFLEHQNFATATKKIVLPWTPVHDEDVYHLLLVNPYLSEMDENRDVAHKCFSD
jgi:hypothetical protein